MYEALYAGETIVAGHADATMLARQILADPDYALKVVEGRTSEIVWCDHANSCLRRLVLNIPVACHKNPEMGREDPAGSATNVPSGVVSPTSVEEVQAIARIANEHRVPVWPISRGKNNGYGGAAPQVRGALMLAASRDGAIRLCRIRPGEQRASPCRGR
ncbi:FAD-binding protein [Streptomyces sp. NBC_01483]|uniref:FAD-binding protein n=1 Tax=Streptomyces sp. NBC_01483 TaxID=2903883 RepID=UPI002E358CB5|nr:FAD-binding protein [Streptomyces sp. NBC_01483]